MNQTSNAIVGQATPGPWRVEPAVDGFEFDVKAGADGYFIAAIPDVPQQTEANANLIAAAPDLLGTLKSIADAAEHLVLLTAEGSRAQQLAQHCALTARAAIAKAEGREPLADPDGIDPTYEAFMADHP